MNPIIKISEKIAQVRLEPEHVRLRYVWGAVAISMLVILTIWIFSLGSLFQGEKNSPSQGSSATPGITEQLKTLKEQTPSIKDFTDQSSNTGSEGITNATNEADFQYPSSAEDAPPQASAYSDLSAETPTR